MTAQPTSTEPHLTTGQLRARFDLRQRSDASKAGKPTDRTVTAGMFLAGRLDSVVFTGTDQKVYALALNDADAQPVPVKYLALRALMSAAYDLDNATGGTHHLCVVVADRATLRRLAKMADRKAAGNSTPEERRLSRLLSYRNGLPASVFTPVLTEALASRYWLQHGLDVDSLDDWTHAFTKRSDTTEPGTLRHLIAQAMDGAADDEAVKTLTQAEKYGVRAAQGASLSAACSAYTKATAVADAFGALMALDPLLRERNAIDGSVAQVRILQQTERGFTATVSDPFKLRPGTKVMLFDGHATLNRTEATLKDVDFKDGTLIATFSNPPKNNPHRHLVEEAKKNYRPLFATSAPFFMVKKAPKNGKWVPGFGDEPKSLPVDIPVDIALAGAPVAD